MSRSRMTFRAEEARQVLWVRCLEEADATGALVPVQVRAHASREANGPDDAAFLVRRAALVSEALPPELKSPSAKMETWLNRLPAWSPWALLAGAFTFGWITGGLGPGHDISILSFPLLGLIAWNLTVVFASLWSEFKSRRKPKAPPATFRRIPGTDGLTAAKGEYLARVAAWEKPAQAARLKYLFHAAAIALALGVVTGMYVRGLAVKYNVTWDSTFLSEGHVRNLTRMVLGPASLLTGIPVPEPGTPVSELGTPVSETERKILASAAPWIHLWAATAGLFILIPRLILINMARREAARAQPDFKAEFSSWLAVCRSMVNGQTHQAAILPVHYEPEPRVRDAIRLLLQHHWGAQVSADFLPPVVYGTEDAVTAPNGAEFLVVVFPLSTTPESEVHSQLIAALGASGPPSSRRLLVLDASNFESRFRTLPEFSERLAARRAVWEKAAAGVFPVLILDDAARRDPAAAARSLS